MTDSRTSNAAEISAHLHPVLPANDVFDIERVECEFDGRRDTGTVTLALRSQRTGEPLRLTFEGATWPAWPSWPPEIDFVPASVYVLDIAHRQWGRHRVEVGVEAGGAGAETCFYAASVGRAG